MLTRPWHTHESPPPAQPMKEKKNKKNKKEEEGPLVPDVCSSVQTAFIDSEASSFLSISRDGGLKGAEGGKWENLINQNAKTGLIRL